MYEGFLGTENSRDPLGDNNLSILSGELEEDPMQWSHTVVRGEGLDTNTKMDGFRITKGKSDALGERVNERGGSIFLQGSKPMFSNLLITGNSAVDGGGMRNVQFLVFLFLPNLDQLYLLRQSER